MVVILWEQERDAGVEAEEKNKELGRMEEETHGIY